MSRSRAWCFTINNETFNDLIYLIESPFRYLCFGFETGESGTHHLQGYIYFDDAKSMRTVKMKCMPRAHLEISRGSVRENIEYTSKEGDWHEIGERPAPGSAQWSRIVTAMQDPMSNPHLYQQYNKMYRSLTLAKKKTHDIRLILIDSTSIPLYVDTSDMYDNDTVECYDGEKYCLIEYQYASNFDIMRWCERRPQKFRRGYEIICFDPEVIYLSTSTPHQFAEAHRIYGQYIEN